MPQDLMQMLLGGGGQNSFQQGQGMLAPSVPVSVTPPQQPQMGPEESAAMAMFSPPKDENELGEIKQGWSSWLENSKKKPQFFQAMAAFGAALARPGGFAKNFTEAAAIYQNTLAQGQEKADEKNLQKFGVLQQARSMDRQTGMQQEQLKLQQADQRLNQDRFDLTKIESQENRSLALENLGIKKRELVMAEAESRSTLQRDGMQNGLLQMQIKKIQADLDKAGFYESTPGEPIGTTYVKEKANSLLKADPKMKPDQALELAMKDYTANAASFVPTATGQVTPKDEFNAKIKLMTASLSSAIPGIAGKDVGTMSAEADGMVTAAKGGAAAPATAPDPALLTLAKTLQSEGYTLSGHDPNTRTIFVEKNGKIEKKTY